MKYLRSLSSAKIIIAVACLLLILASPTRWSHAASVDRDKLLEGAKKEGPLVLYVGMDLEEANLYSQEFTKKYPFIKTDVFRSAGVGADRKIQSLSFGEERIEFRLVEKLFADGAVMITVTAPKSRARFNSSTAGKFLSGRMPRIP
jgi:hypothetical protein